MFYYKYYKSNKFHCYCYRGSMQGLMAMTMTLLLANKGRPVSQDDIVSSVPAGTTLKSKKHPEISSYPQPITASTMQRRQHISLIRQRRLREAIAASLNDTTFEKKIGATTRCRSMTSVSCGYPRQPVAYRRRKLLVNHIAISKREN